MAARRAPSPRSPCRPWSGAAPTRAHPTENRPRHAAPRAAASYLASGESTQKPQIVVEEQPQIVDAIAQHRQPLDAGAKRVAGVALRIDAAGFEHARMHHAAAGNLEPAGLLADATACAAAEHAGDVDLGGRLGEGEVRGTQPHGKILLEESLHEVVHDRLEVGEADTLIDEQALHLVEHR